MYSRSVGVLVSELAALYAGREDLPELPIQYADFAVWQRNWLRGEVLESQLAHWREELAGAPTVLELPADRPRPAALSYRGGWEGAALRSRLRGNPSSLTAMLDFFFESATQKL